MIVTLYDGVQVPCTRAVQGTSGVELYDGGNCIYAEYGISESLMAQITITGGEWEQAPLGLAEQLDAANQTIAELDEALLDAEFDILTGGGDLA